MMDELLKKVGITSEGEGRQRRLHRGRLPTKDVACQTTDDPLLRYPSLTSLTSSVGGLFDQSSLLGASLLDVTGLEAGGGGGGGCGGGPAVTTRRIELTAEFQRLNILLLRAVTGKMIGTALLTEVKIHSTSRPAANNQVMHHPFWSLAGVF